MPGQSWSDGFKMFPHILKLFIYLSGCIRSWLQHVASPSCHVGSFLVPHRLPVVVLGLSSCRAWAQLFCGGVGS